MSFDLIVQQLKGRPYRIAIPWGVEYIYKLTMRLVHPENGLKQKDVENCARLGALVLMLTSPEYVNDLYPSVLEDCALDTVKQLRPYTLPERTKTAIAACVRDWEDLTQEHIWEIARCYAEFLKLNAMKIHPKHPECVRLDIKTMIRSCMELPTMDFLLGRGTDLDKKTSMKYQWEPETQEDW